MTNVRRNTMTEMAVRELEGVAVELLADHKLIRFDWRVMGTLAKTYDAKQEARVRAVLRRVQREKEARGMTPAREIEEAP